MSSMPAEGEEKSFKEENGYTKAGSIFKSRKEKEDRERKQKRLNGFSQEQNKEAANALRVNTEGGGDKEVDQPEFDSYGLPKPGQKYRRGNRPADNPMGRK